MISRRNYSRISTQHHVDLYLYDRSNDCQLTGRVTALLLDQSKLGAGLKFPQVYIDGNHLFYSALDSDTIFITIVFQPTDDDPEKMTTLLARPVWFNRDMEDSDMPFRMGIQFVADTTPRLQHQVIPCEARNDQQDEIVSHSNT